VRQLAQLAQFIGREIPPAAPLLVAGDFNDWGALINQPLARVGLRSCSAAPTPTFPARLPLVQFDHVYARGLRPVAQQVPRGRIWWRMSDHLPLIAEFELEA
jgi:endonuclease/exonuclease/phosphatase family metal-dependent hydrolase